MARQHRAAHRHRDALTVAFDAAAMAAQSANALDDHRDKPVDLARVRQQVQRFG